MNLVLISFMHLYLFSIRELISVITSNYQLVDDVEASQYFQTNGFKEFGFPYCFTLKLKSKHSIDSLLQTTQKIIIIYNKD